MENDAVSQDASTEDWEDLDDDDVDEDVAWAAGPNRTKHLILSKGKRLSNITFKRLLQHYFASIKADLSDVTLFLKLFKHYRPKVDYNDLPSFGKTLLKVGVRGFGGKNNKLPAVIPLGKSGKYVHFGLEKGLSGDSPGDVFHHSGILQFVSLYKQDPLILPTCIRQKVFFKN